LAFGTLACFAVLLVATGKLGAVQNSAAWITDGEQQQIVRRIRTILPGWTIRQRLLDRTPDDWDTLDNRGFEIDGKNEERVFQIWFVPKDWLGIRQSRANRTRLVYWEGVLMGQGFKTITNTDQAPVLEALLKLGMHTPSLVNGGWYEAEKLFRDRMSEVDSRAQKLVSRFCKDQSCRDEAAYSLIVLGVPARTITLDCAEHAKREDAQGFCVSALGYLGGADSVRTLGKVISNPLTSPAAQNYAAMSLNLIADPSAGPALLKALLAISWPEAAAQAAEALGRIHYESAAPEILSRMKKEPLDGFQQAYYARALASLRYQPAVPTIEKLCNTTKFSGDWLLKEQEGRYLGAVPEIALLRLSASWGAPSDGIRLLLLPSEISAMPGQVRAVAVIENVGDRDRDISGLPDGYVIVDGARYQQNVFMVLDGPITLRVNDVKAVEIDLSGLIVDAGPHRVESRLGTANSNQLTLGVPRSNH